MLTHPIIAYETEQAARARLSAHFYKPDIAAEIAIYFAQATDPPPQMGALRAASACESLTLTFVALDGRPPNHHLPLGPALARSMRRAHARAGTRAEA